MNIFLRLIGLLGALLVSQATVASPKEVVILTLEYPPLVSEAMPSGGVFSEVLRQALYGSEWTVRLKYVPWARVPAELTSSEVAGALPCWESEIESFGLKRTKAVFVSQLGFYVRRQDARFLDVRLSQLKGKRVGTVRGYGYPEQFLASGIIPEDASSDEINLKKLAAKRFDYIALERAVGDYILSRDKEWSLNAQVNWQGPPFARMPLYIGIKPSFLESAQFIAAIDRGIQRMRQDGRLGVIAKKYGLDLPDLVVAPPVATK